MEIFGESLKSFFYPTRQRLDLKSIVRYGIHYEASGHHWRTRSEKRLHVTLLAGGALLMLLGQSPARVRLEFEAFASLTVCKMIVTGFRLKASYTLGA